MFQTRSEVKGVCEFNTLIGALDAAKHDNTIWKISFNTETQERVRLVRTSEGWTYEDITGDRYAE